MQAESSVCLACHPAHLLLRGSLLQYLSFVAPFCGFLSVAPFLYCCIVQLPFDCKLTLLPLSRLYIEEEIYAPENQAPPLGEGFALAAIRSKARNYRRAGTDVGEILQASQRLAHAQSERQATACRLLPPVHWALLYTIGALFVSTFILFETGGSFSNEGRHILFTVLCGLMSFVLCVSTLSLPLKPHPVPL